MNNRENILERLKELSVDYELKEHSAVFTMDELDSLKLNENNEICKNLFLRDYKGKRHALVILRGDKHADLALIRDEIDSTKLSFASDERLLKYLDVKKGSVSLLGIINDTAGAVEVCLDEDLKKLPRLGFHPNDNTATLFLSFDDAVRYVESTSHEVHFIKV
jgi:Ala-tRNA(Pro) deacylase